MKLDGELKARLKDYWNELDESGRTRRVAFAVCVGLGMLAVPAWFLGRPAWNRWQANQALKQVRVFADAQDYRSAALALRRAVDLNPADPRTWREATRLLGEIGSPEVLTAREQLVRVEPDDPAVRLALAADALRLDRLDLAQTTLAGLTQGASRDAAFYRLAAALALALGRQDELDAALTKLVEVDPADREARLSRAAVSVWSLDEARSAAARGELEKLEGEKGVRVRAALELLKAAARQHDERRLNEALAAASARFVPGWREDFPTGLAGWARLVEQLKLAAQEGGPVEAAALARWLGDAGQPRESLVWLESLPAGVRETAGVRDVAAELSAKIGDLDRLEGYLRGGAWGAWPREALTLAMASRLQRMRYGEPAAKATWDHAVTATGESLAGLEALTRLAVVWNDSDGLERVLKEVTERFPKAVWGHRALANLYSGRRDLAKLWETCDAWQRQLPGDAEQTVRWILLAVLTQHLSDDVRARAEALQAANPRAAGPAVALAAVRWREGRPKETVRLLADAAAKRDDAGPSAFWLGLAYADLGQAAEAERYITMASRGILSGEEARLLQSAAAKAKVRPRSLD